MPPTLPMTFNRDAWAAHYAMRHLAIDNAVAKVIYLPTGSPEREIRLIEVNQAISEVTPMEPIDFGVDTNGPDEHKLFVLDVTPTQWDLLQQGQLSLPVSWTLASSQEFTR
ncbi:hypothetical protein GC163_09175 [bacterium]|nr:hypothetical protein [bacterium]